MLENVMTEFVSTSKTHSSGGTFRGEQNNRVVLTQIDTFEAADSEEPNLDSFEVGQAVDVDRSVKPDTVPAPKPKCRSSRGEIDRVHVARTPLGV